MEELQQVLEKTDLSTLEIETFDPVKDTTVYCKVVDVYDGDTCTVVYQIDKQLIKEKVRMLGYDSAELRPKRKHFPNEEDRQEEIKKGKVARDYLSSLVLGKILVLKCGGRGSFGRRLGTLFLDDQCVNDLMVKSHHGEVYDY